jgi:putative nucleotidyltransferase with HDIG domain
MHIDLRQVIYALADTLDLVGVDDCQHGKRVGLMAFVCGEALGCSIEDQELLFHAALLHDCGVSSTRTHCYLVEELLWDGVEEHCRLGQQRLERFPAFEPLAPIVRHHHTPWEALPRKDLGERDARFANLIFLLDRADALGATHRNWDLLVAKNEIRERLKGFAGKLFAPDLVELFLDVSRSEAFWIMLEQQHLERFLTDKENGRAPIPIGLADMKQLARIFADIVDAKSRFTAEHSPGVSRLARHLAVQFGLDEECCDKVEIAGLLHDLGKLRIPDEILEYPSSLDGASLSAMLRHSFDTYQILRRIDSMEEISQWASHHHEAPSGNGYPFHIKGVEISREARILSVADVFQALAQDRPYRPAMAPEQIVTILRELVQADRLDPDIVEQVVLEPELCWEMATSGRLMPEVAKRPR